MRYVGDRVLGEAASRRTDEVATIDGDPEQLDINDGGAADNSDRANFEALSRGDVPVA